MARSREDERLMRLMAVGLLALIAAYLLQRSELHDVQKRADQWARMFSACQLDHANDH